ncbi:MAG: radical SAM protein [bacterium]
MKVLLIDPAPRQGVPEMYENLGVASLTAASRRAGFDTGMILTHVEGWSRKQLGRELMRRRPDVLGISLLSSHALPTLELLRGLKADGLESRVVLGGHFPTFNDARIMQDWPEVDCVVRGEGDITLVRLLETWRDGGDLAEVDGLTWREGASVRSNPARELVRDLDELPWPARDYTERILRMGGTLNMVRSRGCYANCSFCSIASFYRIQSGSAWRQRSIGDVVDEMAHLSERWPEAELKFHDDQFIGPGRKGREDAMAFAETLASREDIDLPLYIFARSDSVEPGLFKTLKEAGLKSVFVGVESGSQRELDAFDKRVTVEDNRRALQILCDLDIRFHVGLIFFNPYTEMDDVTANMEFIEQTRPLWGARGNILSVENRVIVYKGTPFWNRLMRDGRLEGDYMGYDYTIPDPRVRVLCTLSNVVLNYILPAFSRLVRARSFLRLAVQDGADRFRRWLVPGFKGATEKG